MSKQISNIDVLSVEYLDKTIKLTFEDSITINSLLLSKKAYDVDVKLNFEQVNQTLFINLEKNKEALSVLRGRYSLNATSNEGIHGFNYDSYNSKQSWLRPLNLGKLSWNPFNVYLVAQSELLQFIFDVDVNVESDILNFPYTGNVDNIWDEDDKVHIQATFQITRPYAVGKVSISSGMFLVRSAEQKTIKSVFEEINVNDEKSIFKINASFLKKDLGSLGQWNFGVQLNGENYNLHLKIRRASEKIYNKIFAISEKNWFESSIKDIVIDPQFMSNGNFMLRVHPKTKLETEKTLQNMNLAYEIYNIQNKLKLPASRSSDGVRLVFERETWFAQDNAFAVFKRAKLDKLDDGEMKYVIDADSPFVEKILDVTNETNIIYKYSVEYFYALLTAKELITSIFPLELYSLYKTSGFFVNQVRNIPVYYLGHGLLALKRMTSDYSYGSGLFDRVSVGSTFDYKIHRENLGFGRDNVRKLGYPRWADLLKAQDLPELNEDSTRKILYFPTWRPWVDKLSDDEFIESDYFINIQKLINDKNILSTLKENNCTLLVYLHPNIRRFSKQLAPKDSTYVHVIIDENVSVEELEVQCDLIISDYSSVVWDFAIQNKPVIYYQFDQEKYIATQGSYIDLLHPIYGVVTTHVENMVDILKKQLKSDNDKDISEFLYSSKNSDVDIVKDIMSEQLPQKKRERYMTYESLTNVWGKKERI